MRNEPERRSGDDEIDLFDLIRGLWEQKVVIIVSTVIATLAALSYAFLATPVYEAKVFVQPPSQNDIAHLNYGRGADTGLGVLVVKDIYEVYLRALQSESLRRTFFRDVYLPTLTDKERSGSQDDLYNRFNKVVSVSVASKETPQRYAIVANVSDPQLAANWVVSYAEMAGDRAKREVLKDVKSDATIKANNLQQQIRNAQESARKQREDEIAKLTEALKVAKSIGLEKPPIISDSVSTELTASMDGSLTYMRGSKALEAEIENLQARESDDPFIADLRQKQARLTFYRTLEIEPAVVAVYRQDGGLEQPDKPIKPKKFLIVLIGIFVGVGSGLMLALIRGLWSAKQASMAGSTSKG
ncbi:Lipopolysaccharide biosynthesis protein WzzE [compost metagenome]